MALWNDSVLLPVHSKKTGEVVCVLQFYGVTMNDMYTVPCDYVRLAMANRGFSPDEYSVSMWEVQELNPNRYQMRRLLAISCNQVKTEAAAALGQRHRRGIRL